VLRLEDRGGQDLEIVSLKTSGCAKRHYTLAGRSAKLKT
jgi:hypothetical protein